MITTLHIDGENVVYPLQRETHKADLTAARFASLLEWVKREFGEPDYAVRFGHPKNRAMRDSAARASEAGVSTFEVEAIENEAENRLLWELAKLTIHYLAEEPEDQQYRHIVASGDKRAIGGLHEILELRKGVAAGYVVLGPGFFPTVGTYFGANRRWPLIPPEHVVRIQDIHTNSFILQQRFTLGVAASNPDLRRYTLADVENLVTNWKHTGPEETRTPISNSKWYSEFSNILAARGVTSEIFSPFSLILKDYINKSHPNLLDSKEIPDSIWGALCSASISPPNVNPNRHDHRLLDDLLERCRELDPGSLKLAERLGWIPIPDVHDDAPLHKLRAPAGPATPTPAELFARSKRLADAHRGDEAALIAASGDNHGPGHQSPPSVPTPAE